MRLKDKIKIYALINPDNDYVFYVGATSYLLSDRLTMHIYSPTNKKSKEVIGTLRKNGKKPEIIELDEVCFKDSDFYEQFYIDLYRSYGFDLCNSIKSLYSKTVGNKRYWKRRCMYGIGMRRKNIHYKNIYTHIDIMSYILLNTPKGQYKIPLRPVAENRANYYATEVGGHVKGSENWLEEVNHAMTDGYDAIDWVLNNTNWEEWEPIAIKVNDEINVTDEDFWTCSDDFEII